MVIYCSIYGDAVHVLANVTRKSLFDHLHWMAVLCVCYLFHDKQWKGG